MDNRINNGLVVIKSKICEVLQMEKFNNSDWEFGIKLSKKRFNKHLIKFALPLF